MVCPFPWWMSIRLFRAYVLSATSRRSPDGLTVYSTYETVRRSPHAGGRSPLPTLKSKYRRPLLVTKPVSGGVSPSRRPFVVVGPTAGEVGVAAAAGGGWAPVGAAPLASAAAATTPKAAVARRVRNARRPTGEGVEEGGGEAGGTSPDARASVTMGPPPGATVAPRLKGEQQLQRRG